LHGDVLERQGVSLDLLSKLFMSLIPRKTSLEVLEQLWNCSLLNYWLNWTVKVQN